MEKYILISGFVLLLVLAFIGMYWIMKQARKFHKEADSIEKKLKDGAPQEVVLPLLYKLKEKSFHRTTGERLYTLAKMCEIKYGIKILKTN